MAYGYDNGLMMDGPSITGVWQNPKTGDFFTVKDSYMEEDDIIIITTDGRRLNYRMLQDYSQTNQKVEELKHYRDQMKRKKEQEEDEKILDLIGEQDNILTKPLKKAQPAPTPVPANEDPIMDEEINSLMGNYGSQDIRRTNPTPDGGGIQTTTRTQNIPDPYPHIMDADIIERALRRVKAPEVDLQLEFERYPEKQIDMLVDLMGVDPENIAAWMYEHYFSKNFKEIIINKITEILEDHLCPNDEKEGIDEDTQWEPPFPEGQPKEVFVEAKPAGKIKQTSKKKTKKRK